MTFDARIQDVSESRVRKRRLEEASGAPTLTIATTDGTRAMLALLDIHHFRRRNDVNGGGGIVGTAMWKGLPAFVKLVHSHLWHSEVELLLRFQGAGVLKVFAVHPEERMIVMPRAKGDLLEHINTTGATEEQARVILRAILTALARMHALGIAHKDIKPENILMFRGAGAVLADFGFAGPCGIVEGGSEAYMAPEWKARAAGIDMRRCDVYGVGAVLYVALLRNRSFDTTDARLGGLSDDCKAFLRALLSPMMTERPTAADALLLPWLVDP
jgi:serine/threonine protein kinase